MDSSPNFNYQKEAVISTFEHRQTSLTCLEQGLASGGGRGALYRVDTGTWPLMSLSWFIFKWLWIQSSQDKLSSHL